MSLRSKSKSHRLTQAGFASAPLEFTPLAKVNIQLHTNMYDHCHTWLSVPERPPDQPLRKTRFDK